MSDTPNEFQQLLQRAREGDPAAAEELYRSYAHHLHRAIRQRLNKQPILRRLHDSTDFTQEVWHRFFTNWVHNREFRTPQQFLAYLLRAAQSSVGDKRRQYLQTQKRDLRRDQPLDVSHEDDDAGPAAPGPGPEAAAAGRDEWEGLLRGRPEFERLALRWLADGHTPAEVAGRLRVSEGEVRRLGQREAG